MTTWKQEVSSLSPALVPPPPLLSHRALLLSWGPQSINQPACPSPNPSASVWMIVKLQVKLNKTLVSIQLLKYSRIAKLILYCFLLELSSCDLLSLSSQHEEVRAKVLVCTGDNIEVNWEKSFNSSEQIVWGCSFLKAIFVPLSIFRTGNRNKNSI